jgi:hypothetical protein
MTICSHDWEWVFDDPDEESYFICRSCGGKKILSAREITNIIATIHDDTAMHDIS